MKNKYPGYRLLKKEEVINVVQSGFDYELYYTPSKKAPSEDNHMSATFFNNLVVFERFHNKWKTNLCNHKDGKTIKYYIKDSNIE